MYPLITTTQILKYRYVQAEKQHLEDELEEEGSGVDGNGFVVPMHVLYLLLGNSVDIDKKYACCYSMSSLQASLWKSLGLRAAIAEVGIVHTLVLVQRDPKITPLCPRPGEDLEGSQRIRDRVAVRPSKSNASTFGYSSCIS